MALFPPTVELITQHGGSSHQSDMVALTPEEKDRIRGKVLGSLNDTRYAVSSLEPLSGGVGNFLYRAHLVRPLEDGTAEVAVKHGEGFVATNSSFELTLDRCV